MKRLQVKLTKDICMRKSVFLLAKKYPLMVFNSFGVGYFAESLRTVMKTASNLDTKIWCNYSLL